jgi:hypothetical protein
MKKHTVIFIASAILLPCLLVWAWTATFEDDDPKNIHYVLWKWGLVSIDLDRAVAIMSHDNPKHLVVGKSKEELRKEFGYLRSMDEAAPYLRDCVLRSPWKDKSVMFLRSTDLIVVFDGDKATDVLLGKGCS